MDARARHELPRRPAAGYEAACEAAAGRAEDQARPRRRAPGRSRAVGGGIRRALRTSRARGRQLAWLGGARRRRMRAVAPTPGRNHFPPMAADLRKYRSKRNFDRTPEPAGDAARSVESRPDRKSVVLVKRSAHDVTYSYHCVPVILNMC